MHAREADKIAIVGIGLTFPGGAEDPQTYWDLMVKKHDATVEIPKSRWDVNRFYSPFGSEKPGKMYVKRGGFLQQEAGEFDPLFFGISPREASVMDYQQRILLEVTSKALQDAGLKGSDYRDTDMGVFIGGFCMDAKIEATYNRNWGISHSVTGSTATMLSNRISYYLDAKGPSLTVDTACSSSLVATHLATTSLLSGECSCALVGGVNMMTQPEHFIEMCKGRLLSKDGRCYTWDKRANGYARGEGAAVLVLKTMSKAISDNDHIYALINATGVNQDGATQGISLPNPISQSELIKRVLKKANISPRDISYIEAHGTGTQAGDKAETKALYEVLGSQRDKVLTIGSVKTNIGHLEAAAGVAGLIKACLILKNHKIPPNINFKTPNPDIPFKQMNLHVPIETEDLYLTNGVAHVGVNSFGYGGTNAHVILSNIPESSLRSDSYNKNICTINNKKKLPKTPLVLPISARSKESLNILAKQYSEYLLNYKGDISTFLRRISLKRDHYEYRAAIIGNDIQDLIKRLEKFSENKVGKGISYLPSGDNVKNINNSVDNKQKLIFVFSGMGPQWWGMGQKLLNNEPIFRETILECDSIFKKISGWSLLEKMKSDESGSEMSKTEVAQPCNFALQVGLWKLYKSWGIHPEAVVGHSVGEVTAAYVSGCLSLEDALCVSYYRSKLQSQLAGEGGMLALGVSLNSALEIIKPYQDSVSVAADNAPNAVTLAGTKKSLDSISRQCESLNIFNRLLQVEVAYHSPVMSPIKESLIDSLKHINPKSPIIPCFSTVTGEKVINDAETMYFDAEYWWFNVRKTVLFHDAIKTACKAGFSAFLEVGPHPVLTNAVKDITAQLDIPTIHHTSLNRKNNEIDTIFHSLGLLYCSGHDLNWDEMHEGEDKYLSLPAYPWCKSQYSNTSPMVEQDKKGEGGHTILYRDLQSTVPTWEVELSESLFPYLKDHCISGQIVVPGAFYVETALAVQSKISGVKAGLIKNISFKRFLSIADEIEQEEKRLRTRYEPDQSKVYIYSTTTAKNEVWTLHASGEIGPANDAVRLSLKPVVDVEAFKKIEIDGFYNQISDIGLNYGEKFRSIQTLYQYGDYVYAEIEDKSIHNENTILSPTILDSVFQTLFLFSDGVAHPLVPVYIKSIDVKKAVPSNCKVLGKLNWKADSCMQADYIIIDNNNNILVEIENVTYQALKNHDSNQDIDESSYTTEWLQSHHDVNIADENFKNNLSAKHIAILTMDDGSENIINKDLLNNSQIYNHYHFEMSNMDSLVRVLREEKFERIVIIFNSPISNLSDQYNNSVHHANTLINIVNVINKEKQVDEIELFVCVNDSQPVIDEDKLIGIELAPIWGLVRSINSEYPDIKATCIDYEINCNDNYTMLLKTIKSDDHRFGEFAIRGNEIYEHKLRKIDLAETKTFSMKSSAKQPLKLINWQNSEASESIYSKKILNQNCDDTEVEIEIEQIVLNRNDYVNSCRNIYPNNPNTDYFYFRPGKQCVGIVKKVGINVEGIKVNDRVLTIYPIGISNVARVPAKYIISLPDELSNSWSTQKLPDIYEMLRAAYTLKIIGELRTGQNILLRGTWGTFVETISRITEKKNVSVIFIDDMDNKIEREVISKFSNVTCISLQSITDLNSKDIRESDLNKEIDVFINDSNNELKYYSNFSNTIKIVNFVIDALDVDQYQVKLPIACTLYNIIFDQLLKTDYSKLKEILREQLEKLVTGELTLTTNPTYTLPDASKALAEIGNSITASATIEIKNSTVLVQEQNSTQEIIKSNKTYIITGGTKGFGLSCAQWLVSSGAKHIVLWGRSGLNIQNSNIVDMLSESGANIEVMSVDVADLNAVTNATKKVLDCMPTIAGVIHSAMVLDDDIMSKMNYERLDNVMKPKVKGAINLYHALRDVSLDFILFFSSISSLIGNPGQANYIAANSFLDIFSSFLRLVNVPATTINWGALSDSGVLADNSTLSKILTAQGISGINNKNAMKTISRVVKSNTYSQIGSFNINWRVWSDVSKNLSGSNFYSELKNIENDTQQDAELIEVLSVLLDMDKEGRFEYIVKILLQKFSDIFQMPIEAINPNASIIELGVDSLIASEIIVTLKNEFSVNISLMELLAGPSILKLAENVILQLNDMINSVCDNIVDEDNQQVLDENITKVQTEQNTIVEIDGVSA